MAKKTAKKAKAKKAKSRDITTEIAPGIFVSGWGTQESVKKLADGIRRKIVGDGK